MKCSLLTTATDCKLENEEDHKSEIESSQKSDSGNQILEKSVSKAGNIKCCDESKESSVSPLDSDSTNDEKPSPPTKKQSDSNRLIEKSVVINGSIVKSNTTLGIVIPSKSDVINDIENREIESSIDIKENEQKTNFLLMNIVEKVKSPWESIKSSNDDADVENIVIVDTKENYTSKNPHPKNELNIKNETETNCELNIAALGDCLIKLDLTSNDDLKSTVSSFQLMNISAESVVSDEENASDDDDDDTDNVSNDDAFEGDDENDDDDDYERPPGKFSVLTSFEKEKDSSYSEHELAALEDELISRNPIPQAKLIDRFHPYSSQIQIPVEDPDELVNSLIFKEEEENFLIEVCNSKYFPCPDNETSTTVYQDTFVSKNNLREYDELSMTSDLGRSPQSLPSPSGSFSDENFDHHSEFRIIQNQSTNSVNIPPPVSISSMPVGCPNLILQTGGTLEINNKTSAIERNRNVQPQPKLPLDFFPPAVAESLPAVGQKRTGNGIGTARMPPIQPRQQGPQLCEQLMKRPAGERLHHRTRRNSYSQTDLEWIRLLVKKPGQSPETKHFFINLLKENNETMMEERVFAHNNYIKIALKNPEIFFLRDPDSGYSPLRLAAFNHNSKPLIARCIADFIVETGKRLDYDVDEKGETILHKLAYMGKSHVAVLAELLNVKMPNKTEAYDVNKQNIHGMTPLLVAVTTENFKESRGTLEQLIKHGARIDSVDVYDRNCLHYAVENTLKVDYEMGYEILRFVLQSLYNRLDRAAAMNKCDKEGFTPLHLAFKGDHLSINNQLKVIELLRKFGAEVNIKWCGVSPFTLVGIKDRAEMIKNALRKT